MQIEQHLYITDPDSFLKGDYGNCLTIIGGDWMKEDWILVGVIDVEVNVDSAALVSTVAKTIQEEITRIEGVHEATINALKGRLNELLALDAPK